MDNEVEQLCKMLDDHQITEDRDMPVEIWDHCKKEGFFGMIIRRSGNHH